MNKSLLAAILFGALLLSVLRGAPPLQADSYPTVSDLVWLAGCWARSDGEGGTGEMWTAPAGGTMLGTSRVVKDGRTVSHEFMQLRDEGQGRIVFIARPSGQAEAAFHLVALSATEAVFENLEHDFPQRIIYRLGNGGRLAASIEGVMDGEPKSVDFPMERISCAGERP